MHTLWQGRRLVRDAGGLAELEGALSDADSLRRDPAAAAAVQTLAGYLRLSKAEGLLLGTQERAVRRIQRAFRARLARQHLARDRAAELLLATHERAVRKIQQRVRGRRARRLHGAQKVAAQQSAARIQRIQRGKLARRELAAQKQAAKATAAAVKAQMFASAIAMLVAHRGDELPEEVAEEEVAPEPGPSYNLYEVSRAGEPDNHSARTSLPPAAPASPARSLARSSGDY